MARCIIAALLAMCMVLGVCTPTRAELTAFWRNNPITPQAIADDPALATMQSWSVMVTNTEGFWMAAGLRAVLASPSHFYRNSLGGSFRPSLAQQEAHPALTFHTYITFPGQPPTTPNASLAIFGGFPDGQQLSFGGPMDQVPGTLSVSWADVQGQAHPAGSFEIARLTFPIAMLPVIHPESRVHYRIPDQVASIPTIVPEPVGWSLPALVGYSLIVRRGAPIGFRDRANCNDIATFHARI